MGASITEKGGTDWVLELSRIRRGYREIAEKALMAGANVMADGFRREIEGIPVDERHVKDGEMKDGIKQVQKQGLLNSFGISPIDSKDGVYDVHLGWEGYNAIATSRWPQGQPNKMIARSVNAGTYFLRAHPFIDRARTKYRKEAEQAMEDTIAEELGKITD